MIYVSLTTIPKRLRSLNKSVESLLKQTHKPDKIFINIPTRYERFKEIINDEHIPQFNDQTVEITRCQDFGPGTKLLGSLDKIKKDSLVILADDDHIYEDYMIEKFNYFYSKAPENAYSFYVHPLKNFGVGQGADGFAINSNFLKGINKFYDEVVRTNKDLFIHDDLWTSFFLFYVKKVKILSLKSHIKKNENNKFSLIYKKHSSDDGLISSYGSDINEAVRNRDQIALKSLEYMFDKIKKINF
tara:strand:+ start:1070 stop:1801 length:732 start_codon:yes stop_codon:yes gene_type:complete